MPTDEPRYEMKIKAKSKAELRAAIIEWFESTGEWADDQWEDDLVLDGHFNIADLVDALVEAESSPERRTPAEINEAIRQLEAEVCQMNPSETAARLLDAAGQQQRIAALEAENAELRKALESIVKAVDSAGWHDQAADNAKQIARDALKPRAKS